MQCLLLLILSVGVTASLESAFAENRSGEETRHFTIRQQSVVDALKILAIESDMQLVVSPTAIENVESQALSGTYSVPEALEALLAGTGLQFEITPDNLIIVRES